MPTYDIEITHDGHWWMIYVPELDEYVTANGSVNVGGTTQARCTSEIEYMARDYIAVALDIPIEGVAVRQI